MMFVPSIITAYAVDRGLIPTYVMLFILGMIKKRCDQETTDIGRLLYRLKVTVERALQSRATGVGGNVWLTYGGLLELMVTCVKDIIGHGLKSTVRDDEVILDWLKRSSDHPIISVTHWIRDSLLQYCLKDRLVQLLRDRSAVEEVYCPYAFLCHSPYVESLFLCLLALEDQQPKLLTEIDPALYMLSINGTSLNDMRSRSFPVLSISSRKFTSMEFCSAPGTVQSSNCTNQTVCNSEFCFHCVNEVVRKLVSTVSSHIQEQHDDDRGSSTDVGSSTSLDIKSQVSLNIKPPMPNILPMTRAPGVTGHRRTRSDDAFIRRALVNKANSNRLLVPPPRSETPSSASRSALDQRSPDLQSLKESWLEAAKLRDYLSQRQYETSLELERENAHFLLSEMLIGAIEQMKWRNVLSSQWPRCVSTESMPRSHHSPNPEELASASFEGFSGFSDNSVDNFMSSSGDFSVSVDVQSGSDYVGDSSVPSVDPTASTETDESHPSLIGDLDKNAASSAESVAMNLLQRFSRKHFSSVEGTDMKFLVSYQEVPQLLLPLPQSRPVAPDEIYAEGFKEKVKIRGTFEWAPPRPQLIFKMHPAPKLKPLLEQQCYKCAGCGMKLDKAYLKRLRYCAYLGKLFCQCCHQGQTSVIPSHVLHQWDFRRLPVSDFSYRFLSQQHTAPVWNVKVVNEQLYNSVKPLRTVRRVRQQLSFCYDYIRTCRPAQELVTTNGKLTDVFDQLPSYVTQELDVYSMQDFTQVKDGTLCGKLESALLLARYHIESCEFCRARGFVCEVCRKDEILFPFQANGRVKRCGACGSCFHLKCLRKRECPKCKRLQTRRELVTQNISEHEDELEV